MPKKISDLTAKTTLNNTDSFPISDAVLGADRRITKENLLDALDGASITYVDDKASLSPFIMGNVKAFGAKGDGVTDDYAAIQNAIDYCEMSSYDTLVFPEGNYVVNAENLYAKRNNVILYGLGDVKITFTGDASEPNEPCIKFWDNRGDEGIKTFDNSPPYESITYFDPSQYGGDLNRIGNVGIENINIHFNRSNQNYVISFVKCDNFRLKNVDIRLDGAGSVTSNIIRFFYCSGGDVENIETDDFNVISQLFIFWSYGIEMNGFVCGSATDLMLNIKRAVNSSFSKIDLIGGAITGLNIGYGSYNITIDRLRTSNTTVGVNLRSSPEYDYSQLVNGTNWVIDETHTGLQFSGINGLKLNNIEVEATNFVLNFQQDRKFKFSDIDDAGYIQNSEFFIYDGDYDQKENITFQGVNHWRFYEFDYKPHSKNIEINGFKGSIKSGSTATKLITGQINPVIPFLDLFSDGKLKTFTENSEVFYAASIKNVKLTNFYLFTPSDIKHTGIEFSNIVMDSFIYDNFTFKNVRGNILQPSVFLDNVTFRKINEEGVHDPDDRMRFYGYRKVLFDDVDLNNSGNIFAFNLRAGNEEGFRDFKIANSSFSGERGTENVGTLLDYNLGDTLPSGLVIERPILVNNQITTRRLMQQDGLGGYDAVGKFFESGNTWHFSNQEVQGQALLGLTTTVGIPILNVGESSTQTFTVRQAIVGDVVNVSMEADLLGLTYYAYMSSSETVSVKFTNNTSSATPEIASVPINIKVTKVQA